MKKKILKYITIAFILFILLAVWMFFIQPKIDHKRNLNDLKSHIEFFKSMKHPGATSEIYYKAFFGNSTGSSNHCEHIITQIRKYHPNTEKEIANYYKKNYPEVTISFVKTLDDCCGDNEYGYKIICHGNFTEDQPKLSYKTVNDFLPAYIIEYSVDGSHLSDCKCN